MGDRGHSCEEHAVCGSVLEEDMVVRLWKVQVLADGQEEIVIACCWRKMLGPIPTLVFVHQLMLVLIGPARPNRLVETLRLVFLLLFVALQIL